MTVAGSNLIAVKRALVAVLPGLLGIPVDWSYKGKTHDANVGGYGYLGSRAGGPMAAAAHAGGGRFTRQEDPTFQLAIEARLPGEDTTEAVEALVLLEHGRKVEEYLAGNWKLGGDIPGLLKCVITDFDLESGTDDDGASATLVYTLLAESHVR